MKDFEKDLQTLSRPDIQVDRFKQTLRRDLQASMSQAGAPRWRLAFAAASATAAIFAFLLLIFVLDPAVPARLHASVVGGVPPQTIATEAPATDLQNLGLRYFLDQANASVQVDEEFLQRWYADRARPVSVKSVEDEKIIAIRQFVLTNGERVVVLTEIGSEGQQKDVQSLTASNRTF